MRKVIVNFSGGVDSTVAILEALKKYPKEEIVLCWQDTGAEYLETEAHIKTIAGILELPLEILRRKEQYWDLVKRFTKFPLPNCRYCTHKLKMDAVRSFITGNREQLGDEIIIVTGIRGEESVARSKMKEWRIEERVSLKGKTPVMYWAPCINMSKTEVKERVSAEDLPIHPCYDFSSRCSCWLCMFQPSSVVRTYAEMHPDLYEEACLIEDKIKHKWKDGFGFNDLMNQGRLL